MILLIFSSPFYQDLFNVLTFLEDNYALIVTFFELQCLILIFRNFSIDLDAIFYNLLYKLIMSFVI